jgi:hypothetical protein
MKRIVSVSIYFYDLMLRLYPPQFRAEYADEMRDVFTQSLHEKENTLSLMSLLLAEIRDLPVSIIRERLREWQQRVVLNLEAVIMQRSYYSPRLFRFLARTLLLLVCLYICSAVAAYFVFDLRVNAWDRAWEWWNTYDDNPGYIGNFLPLGLAGYCFWMIAPAWAVLAGGLLTLMLLRQWPNLTRQMRWWGICALLAGAAMFLSMGSPIGYMAVLWSYD